ncbi:MAG: hypothetical protein U1E17_08370 [Geminicoccaceae bacterium]
MPKDAARCLNATFKARHRARLGGMGPSADLATFQAFAITLLGALIGIERESARPRTARAPWGAAHLDPVRAPWHRAAGSPRRWRRCCWWRCWRRPCC